MDFHRLARELRVLKAGEQVLLLMAVASDRAIKGADTYKACLRSDGLGAEGAVGTPPSRCALMAQCD